MDRGIVAARDSYEEGKYEQAAFRLLMGIFGCIMGARDYRNALRDCNVSVAVDETPNGGGGSGCVGEEDVNARITGSRNGSPMIFSIITKLLLKLIDSNSIEEILSMDNEGFTEKYLKGTCYALG